MGESPVLGGGYVGSAKCAECHNKADTAIYDRFMKFSRKSQAYQSVKRMKGLEPKERESCYRCHTTGYGKPTGFVSPEKTPHLADVGCEACHGPGKLHTQTMDMAHIVRKVTIDVCEKCHKDAKVKSFRYKGVIYAGAH
ncbi:MAG: cytochrome c family protein [Deltaproteobacteria bacterium]|nr:cytochrome c family protein [Deltaproteobacteria bacterium]